MLFRSDIDQANMIMKNFPWLDFYIVEVTELKLTLYGTMDSSIGKQIEIEFHNISYIDMPMSWKADLSVDAPISMTPTKKLSKKIMLRYLDNGSGNMYEFFAEAFTGNLIYRIFADRFSFAYINHPEYSRWGMKGF